MKTTYLGLLAALLFSSFSQAQEIKGVASVIDGDTLEIHGERIRLSGIDAPESGQLCQLDGSPWRCGQTAALALSDQLGRSSVRCVSKTRDHYGRHIALCYQGKLLINEWLVASGHALDWPKYSRGRYASAQTEARQARRGLWASEFEKPWIWRKNRR